MEFPSSIKGFGYEFSEEGKLRDIKTGEPFKFEVKENNHAFNQSHYEALGEVITPHIYELLEKDCGLIKYPVPKDASKKEAQTFIFCSENFLKAEKLLVLIHGSGVVRAGQWARRLIINDSLNSGTQIPFIKRGIKENYGILVMNTNDNSSVINGQRETIKGSENAESHGLHVWENYIAKCAATKIVIVAHSYGGVVTTRLFKKFNEDFLKRVKALAMTDSVHFCTTGIDHLIKIGQNWVTSSLPLDSSVNRKFKDIPCVSAGLTFKPLDPPKVAALMWLEGLCVPRYQWAVPSGTSVSGRVIQDEEATGEHELTSWSSFESIFKFFEAKLSASEANLLPEMDVTPLDDHSEDERRKAAESVRNEQGSNMPFDVKEQEVTSPSQKKLKEDNDL